MNDKKTDRASIRNKLMMAFLLQSSFLGIFICYSTRKVLKASLIRQNLPAQAVKEILFDFTTIISSLTLLGIVIVLFLAFLFSRAINRGLKSLMKGINEIQNNNLTHVISIDTNDEISEVADAFNMMISELNIRKTALENSSRELKETNKTLNKHREHLQELVEEKTKAISAELKEHERLESDIKQILDVSSDAIRVIDKDFNIVYTSKSFNQLHGQPLDIVGRKCYEVVPEKECFTNECSLKRVIKTGKKFSLEREMETEDGTKVPYHIDVIPYTDSDGKFAGIIKNYRDITDEKKINRIAEENALQQGRIEMANNVLHDIGNAMTEISIYVSKPVTEKKWQEIQLLHKLEEMFAAGEDKLIKAFGKEKQQALNEFIKRLVSSFEKRNDKYLDSFKNISASVGHVCSVLDLQRHYLSEKTFPLIKKINIATIINDTIVMMHGSINKRNIKLLIELGEEDINISGDQTRLIRVFLNIIKNSCEAFDNMDSEEERKMKITVIPDKNKGKINIVFEDNGIGFASEISEELFERGFSSKTNGTGIGLHECRSIIESHDGTISIKSNGVNTGSSTIITLPILK